MRMKYFLTITCLCLALLGQAQTGTVKGLVLRQPGGGPLNEASVLLPAAKMITSTNEQGAFELDMVPYGTYTLRVSADGYTEEEVEIDVHSALTEVPVIKLSEGTTSEQNQMADQSAVSEETATSEDQNNTPLSGQNVSSALNASRDAYLSAATFNWGPYFYRMRGYEPDEHTLYLNGVPMNDLEEGGVFYNALSGLNDIFRGRTVSLGLAPVDYSFGSLGLNTQLDASASNQRKGTRLTYTLTNRAYRDRIMLTHSSGIQKNGWSCFKIQFFEKVLNVVLDVIQVFPV